MNIYPPSIKIAAPSSGPESETTILLQRLVNYRRGLRDVNMHLARLHEEQKAYQAAKAERENAITEMEKELAEVFGEG